ncbi:MAG: cation:dicarboxylase symporter family transporter [Mogibacterium sp.]|nr:cation:dicarboxylase symporter family transporter [Mogibacterium sp.]
MKTKTNTLQLNLHGVDMASAIIQEWLESVGIERKDILRIRLTMEEMLIAICENGDGKVEAELRFSKRKGDWWLRINYDGERFDPTTPAENELGGWSEALLARTGFVPSWRWRTNHNELSLLIPSKKRQTGNVMLIVVVIAIVTGLLGQFLPEAVKTISTDYALTYLSDCFLHLLNTFIGMMVFLSIVTGICGIGSAADFGRIGKLMMSRFVASTFILCAFIVFVSRFFFPLGEGGDGGGFKFETILKMIFDIIPANPVSPFLEGNTLQIVFLATIIGIIMLLTGSETEGIRNLFLQAQTLIMRCVEVVCTLLPLFIFCSLVMLFWSSGTKVLLQLWKPIVVGTVLSAIIAIVYIFVVCRKLKVKLPVLINKLIPDFIIALSTASSAAAFATSMEINEKKLGIDPSFSRTAVPIGGILCAGSFSMLYVVTAAFLAEYYGMHADIAWWIILWLVCSLLSMATPPVAGGMISCMSILILQMGIPQAGLAIGATLTMVLDFICTAFRFPILHAELILQADKLGLLDHEILQRK